MQTSSHQQLEDVKVGRYREKAKALMERLGQLQGNNEKIKAVQHQNVLREVAQKEESVLSDSKRRENSYQRIIKLTQDIENELIEQQYQAQKCAINSATQLKSAEKTIDQMFEVAEKEQKKGEDALERWVSTHLQSTIAKNRSAWKEGSLIDSSIVQEEVEMLAKEHKRLFQHVERESAKLKRETKTQLKSLKSAVQQDAVYNDQPVLALLKRIQADVGGKLSKMRQLRTLNEQKILDMLERVVESCLKEKQGTFLR